MFFQQLINSFVWFYNEWLIGQRNFVGEFFYVVFNYFFCDFFWFIRLYCDIQLYLVFFFYYFSGYVFWFDEFWFVCSNVYSDVFNQFFVSVFSSNQNVDMCIVLIRIQNVVFQCSNAVNVDVFINFCYQCNMFFFELCFQNFNVSDFVSNSCVQNFVCECLEISVFCNEVSLVVNFQNDVVVVVDFGFDYVVSSNVVCFFCCFNSIGFMYVFDCQFDVVVSFSQCFFVIYYVCVSMFMQFFYQGCGNFSYFKIFGDVICLVLNCIDIKVKKGVICRFFN